MTLPSDENQTIVRLELHEAGDLDARPLVISIGVADLRRQKDWLYAASGPSLPATGCCAAEGLISVLDAIQDYLVHVGLSEEEVFGPDYPDEEPATE